MWHGQLVVLELESLHRDELPARPGHVVSWLPTSSNPRNATRCPKNTCIMFS